MDLPLVRRIAGEVGCSDRESVDALRPAAVLLDDPSLPVDAVEADHLARQVDASSGFDLVRRRHAVSLSVFVLSHPLNSPLGACGSRWVAPQPGRGVYEVTRFWGCARRTSS